VSATEFVASSVATLLIQEKQILLGRRFEQDGKNALFSGWQCPGGYLKKGESIEQAAQRHCLQKAGIEISQLRAGPYSNNIFSERLHTTTLYIIAEKYQLIDQLQFKNMSDEWSWFDIAHLPESLYLPLRLLRLDKIFL